MNKQDDNFVEAYRMLEQGAEMYARLYGLDEFTVWNHVAKEIDAVRLKMYEGFIEKPITYSTIQSIKTNAKGNTVLNIRKGSKSKDVELLGGVQTVDISDLKDDHDE